MRIVNWINDLQGQGKYSFTKELLINSFPNKTEKAIEAGLYRLVRRKEIQSIFKGFYVVVPIQYRNLGGLPPSMFIADLMDYLDREYYISHLSAAALHGSGHHQPQEFYVTHNKLDLRKINKGPVPLNFIKKISWIKDFIEIKKTDAGYINVSNPLMTIFDLINDQNRMGGINKITTVINELLELIQYDPVLVNQQMKVTVQRLGFIQDFLGFEEKANELFEKAFKNKKPVNRYPLRSGRSEKGYSSKNRWNIIENVNIEIDE